MSDSGEIEVEAIQGYQVLPKDVTAEIGSIKLFNKWVRKPDDFIESTSRREEQWG